MTEVETILPESFLEPRKYRVTFSCESCGHTWTRTFKAVPKKDPPCPSRRCIADTQTAALRQEVANLRQMLEEQKPPGHIGANNLVKAWDMTQNIVAEDAKVTNLNDRPHEGESMAPKLEPRLQAAADNFFGGAKARGTVLGESRQQRIQNRVMSRLSQRALAGAFKSAALSPSDILPRSSPRPILVANDGSPPRRS